jgi:hypothetical protein
MSGRIAYYGNIIRDGLVLHLDAGKVDSYPRTGTLWRDLSGNNNNGTLTNFSSPSPQTIWNGDNGGSIVFDGTNDFINLGTGLNFTSFSSCFWVKFNSLSNQVIITKGDWDTNNASYTIAYYSNQIRTDTFQSTTIYGTTTYNFSPTLGIWYHIAFIADAITSSYSLFINGVKVTFTFSNTFRTPKTDVYSVNIGRNTTGTYPLNSNISNTLIYNRALSSTEITQNYNALKGRYNL